MRVQIYSSNLKDSVDVELEGVTSDEYQHISDVLIEGLERNEPAYNAVAQAMLTAIQLCPQANPVDLWVHVVYREYRLRAERSDQSWKRVSGQAFEYVLLSVYTPRLAQRDIVLRSAASADAIALGLHGNSPMCLLETSSNTGRVFNANSLTPPINQDMFNRCPAAIPT